MGPTRRPGRGPRRRGRRAGVGQGVGRDVNPRALEPRDLPGQFNQEVGLAAPHVEDAIPRLEAVVRGQVAGHRAPPAVVPVAPVPEAPLPVPVVGIEAPRHLRALGLVVEADPLQVVAFRGAGQGGQEVAMRRAPEGRARGGRALVHDVLAHRDVDCQRHPQAVQPGLEARVLEGMRQRARPGPIGTRSRTHRRSAAAPAASGSGPRRTRRISSRGGTSTPSSSMNAPMALPDPSPRTQPAATASAVHRPVSSHRPKVPEAWPKATSSQVPPPRGRTPSRGWNPPRWSRSA